ncbi:MAG: hypothetical protein JXA30_00210 [Deltaproteobacteria bacterium]|nr:hypothetical protein [Deltaproteobacteria bacterium]
MPWLDCMKGADRLLLYRWRKAVGVVVFTAAVFLVTSPVCAAEEDADLSYSIPSGYIAERHGAVDWVFQPSTRSETEELREIAQSAWKRITSDLGGGIDPKIEIRIAINPEQMQALAPKSSRLPSYAAGVAFPGHGLILLTLTAPESWQPVEVKTVLVHELSHLALHRAVNGASLPRWFSEGIAIYHAQEHSFARTKTLWEGSLQSRLIPLERLSESFPSRRHQVNLAYAQSADFIGFLLDGEDNHYRFAQLINNLRHGMVFSEAVGNAYHLPLGYLEREWVKSLRQRFGRWPLLLTGMGTLWVLACVLLLIAYLQMKRKHRATLKRWELEEARIAQLQKPAPTTNELQKKPHLTIGEAQAQTPDRASIPTIEYDGQQHTLH